jgi:hypothetical protein
MFLERASFHNTSNFLKKNNNEINLITQITANVPEEVYKSVQYDALFENEETAYIDIIPALGSKSDFPK